MGKRRRNNAPKALKWALGVLLLCTAGTLFYCFPPFRIVPLDAAKQQQEKETFDPKAFAKDFWNEKLMKSLGLALQASELLPAIRGDPKTARNQYSHGWGIGSDYYYFLRGGGRVVSVGADSVSLSLRGDDSAVDISIAISNIFGNAIRNGSGLIDVSDFENSQDLNNVSLEINRIVEQKVLPPFREKVAVGSKVRFVGCAEIMDEDSDLYPMRIIPILLEVQ